MIGFVTVSILIAANLFVFQQYQQVQHPHVAGNYLTANQRNSSSPFGQTVISKPSQDAMYSQQFSGSPKSNGPHAMMPVSKIQWSVHVLLISLAWYD
jgi:hypothetical protein